MVIKQYSIVLVNLNPTKGSEIKKTRPCTVVSPNEMNRHLNTVVIVPMTTVHRDYPSRVDVTYDQKSGRLAVDQIRTIDKTRIVRSVGTLSNREIKSLKDKIYEIYVV